MQGNAALVFDQLAADYDMQFTSTLTGTAQRAATRKHLLKFLRGKSNLRILEINCGTGEDAQWLSMMGHQVTATDASARMIEQANNKNNSGHRLQFLHSSFSELQQKIGGRQFDLVFSNFSGINCIDSNELTALIVTVENFLSPNGHAAFVIFGKHCFWESAYYLLKCKPGKAFRRWKKRPVVMNTVASHPLNIWYHSAKLVTRMMNHFSRIEKKPVGLFIPPSYLEKQMQQRPRFFRLLERLDKKFSGLNWLSNNADHQFLLFKKN
jgi:ubiquinone/menaquinone biosynthesis C-methylase UbiE